MDADERDAVRRRGVGRVLDAQRDDGLEPRLAPARDDVGGVDERDAVGVAVVDDARGDDLEELEVARAPREARDRLGRVERGGVERARARADDGPFEAREVEAREVGAVGAVGAVEGDAPDRGVAPVARDALERRGAVASLRGARARDSSRTTRTRTSRAGWGHRAISLLPPRGRG